MARVVLENLPQKAFRKAPINISAEHPKETVMY